MWAFAATSVFTLHRWCLHPQFLDTVLQLYIQGSVPPPSFSPPPTPKTVPSTPDCDIHPASLPAGPQWPSPSSQDCLHHVACTLKYTDPTSRCSETSSWLIGLGFAHLFFAFHPDVGVM